MKKSIAIILSLVIVMSVVMAACASDSNEDKTTTGGLEAAGNEYGFETVDVTDENGKSVTDKNGNTVTTEVQVEYVTNKKGKTVARLVDANGEVVTDKKGNEVTVKTDVELTTASSTNPSTPTTKKKTTTESTTASTQKNEATTDSELTTISTSKDKVPSTSAKGDPVKFSSEDQQIIKNMLEVPYLYEASYENADGVPINIAAHTAIWMAEREGLNTSSFASGTIVLDLFKYYGQTVVNFKTKCNEESGNSNISYNSKNDTFTISNFENNTHTISIEKIEDLGNNNYYKVTASVSGAKKVKKVYAIIQKNKLDSTLGFSIKALNWK
ncbi:MAG: hypothetical protein ACLUFN_09385 [Eubacterium sp.]